MKERTGKQRELIAGCLCAIGCETLYGFSSVFTKKATETAGTLALLGWRFLIAAAIMGVCALFGSIKIKLKGKSLRPLLLVALFSPVIYFIGETAGIALTTASESGAFLACIPVASISASALLLKKKPTRVQVTGILITLTGVLITIFVVGATSSLSFTGYLFLLAAVISYALYCVSVEKASGFSGAEITYVMLTAGAAVFVVLALTEAAIKGNLRELITLPLRNRDFLYAILYQGIGCSIIAFFLSNVAISKIGVNRASSFIGVATVISITAGALILREPFTPFQIAGAAVIIAGVYIANAKPLSG